MSAILHTETESATLPAGLGHAFAFAAFNALSFQIVLGSPMVLYAKTLDASATVLGIIAGMMPLLVIFQIPAANYVDRVGYKRFVYAGWGVRVMFIFVMALIPLTAGFLNATTRLSLILLLLFAFNLSRGISSAAWLPWLTALIPAPIRGKYLSREAGFINLSSFVTLAFAAACLGSRPAGWQFSVVFAFSGLMGVISLSFLKRIPEAAVPENVRASKTPVPYREMTRLVPFRKLLWSVFGWSMAYGGMTTFTVAYLKAETSMSEAAILLVTATSFLGGFGSLWFLGSRMDRLGSKPILLFSFTSWIVIIAGWAALAARLLPPRSLFVVALQFAMGLAAALINMANTRLAMAIIPAMGRNHFFAIYSVVLNVTLGISPILWGICIDASHDLKNPWGGFEWNRFSLFFVLVGAMFVVTLTLVRRLEEPEAASMEVLLKDLLLASPRRVWFRLWPRL